MSASFSKLLGASVLLWALGNPAPGKAALVIDGRADEPEWSRAQTFDAFVAVQPLTGEPQPVEKQVEARLLSLPEGLAVWIRAMHPPSVPQTRTRMRRDGTAAVDRFNFIVDFDADGRSGYAFTITAAGDVADRSFGNENSSSYDWDGHWQHGVSDFEGGYSVEYLIPWTLAAMRGSRASTRTIAVYFDRVIAATGERYAYPYASAERPRFLSEFAHIEVAQQRPSLLSMTNYAVAVADLGGGGDTLKSGADILWKPNGEQQFAVSVNPDFGQVESDELVVNFSAVENLFTDKRPFFTENQSYFDLQHQLGQLFYTRRVGGPADDGGGAADIRVALKAIGSFGKVAYGAFLADESGDAGREFGLIRGTYGVGSLLAGATLSHVEHPFLGRSATVAAFDADWKPSDELTVRPLIAHSTTAAEDGFASGIVADWDPDGSFSHQFSALYADAQFELNDLGYQERNDFLSLQWLGGLRQDRLPADSPYVSHDWELELIHRENSTGLRLSDQVGVHRTSPRRDGGFEYAMARWRASGLDDMVSRGHGRVATRGGPHVYFERHRPRQGATRWGWYTSVEAKSDPIAGYSMYAGVQPEFQLGPQLDFDVGLYLGYQDEWTIWLQETRFGAFETRRADVFSNLNWFIGDRAELRVKLQAIALSADARESLQLLPTGELVRSPADLQGFSVKNLGFQVRYRHRLSDASELFVVYSRGGYTIDDRRQLGNTLSDTFGLDQDHQFQFKFTHRFGSS